jgi:O-antigen/teichoic acid export membrane protein
VFLPHYFKVNWHIDSDLWKRMMKYGLPIFFAGIAFAVNEHFDKIILEKILPANVAKDQVGVYSACYKLALFMTLYATAFRLGIEPFFFSHSGNDNAKQTYATITKYFVIFGSLILLSVVIFADILKLMLLKNPIYWEAMKVVPLIIVANFFLGIYTNLSVWYKLIDKTYIGAYISAVGAIVTLALNFILIPIFQKKHGDGYMGSAVATIAAYGTMMTISYVMGQKRYTIPYDMKRILGYLVVSIGFSWIAFYVFRENYLINIPLLLVFMILIYLGERETLEKILKRKSRTKKMEV